jgi:hypothetical protein
MDWLAKNPRYTARYALHVGALCRELVTTPMVLREEIDDAVGTAIVQMRRAARPAIHALER